MPFQLKRGYTPLPMKTASLLTLLPWILGVLPVCCHAGRERPPPDDLSALDTSQLEERLAAIDAQLENLASFSLRGGIGSIGYRSYWDSATQWIEIELDQAYPIHQIILTPCLSRHPTEGFRPDAFPRELRVLAGTSADRTGSVIAHYRESDGHAQGIEPLILPVSGSIASWIRIEATDLSVRNFDDHKVLQLSEVLIFSGSENVALQRPVKCSSSDERGLTGAWHKRFLVDGFMPYLMDSATGTSSNAFIAIPLDEANLMVDLGSPQAITRMHMHAVEQGDTVPQAYYGDLGIPLRMRIEVANTPDFSDGFELLEYRKGRITETGPIIILQFPETRCRYVRLIPLKPENVPDESEDNGRIGFAEIEIFSKGENVALGKVVTSKGLRYGRRKLEALTDGNNLYGEILPFRDWMVELASRGALEIERPLVARELNHRYERQKVLLTRMMQLVVLLTVGIAFIILIDRIIRQRKISQVRERIAADLHDDLGANIHTIGLISDMAKNSVDSREELIELLDQIRDFTERSGESARYCTNILEARGICEDLVSEMKQFSSRLLADMENENSFEGEEFLRELHPHKRIDLFLFYKECLTNILRHSGATKVITQITADHKMLSMTVTDNGKGLANTTDGKIPRSLRRRAKLLGAKIATETPQAGGTRFILKLRTHRFGMFK